MAAVQGFDINQWSSPHQLGLPAKFDHWRPGQKRIIQSVLEGWEGDDVMKRRRFQLREAPTGSGKSSIYMSVAVALSAILGRYIRVAVLTKDKALQDQLLADFGPLADWDAMDLRGRNNYDCVDYRNTNCSDAARHCRAKHRCPYQQAFVTACGKPSGEEDRNEIVVMNNAYWLSMALHGSGINEKPTKANPDPRPWDMLVIDEGHAAPQSLADVLSHEIIFSDLVGNGGLLGRVWPAGLEPELTGSWGSSQWQEWGLMMASWVAEEVEKIKSKTSGSSNDGTLPRFAVLSETTARKLTALEKLQAALDDLVQVEDAPECDIVWELREEKSWSHGHERTWMTLKLDHVYPAGAAEWLLFRKIPRVLITSATLAPKVRRGLSIPEDQCYYESVPTTFDQRRCPVYFIPSYCGRNNRTGKEKVVSVDYNSTPDELLTVLATADRIIDLYRRHNLNGIVHTTSYKLAKLAVDNSRHRDIILYHRSGELAEQIVKLKSNPNRGLVLFSPSVITGYDFPDGQCRYQILLKVPHRQRSTKIMKERLKRDSWYVEGLVADDMVQAAPGRGMRHPGDWCVSYILDGSFLWWERRVRGAGLVPGYWTVLPSSNIAIPYLTGQEPFLQVAR